MYGSVPATLVLLAVVMRVLLLEKTCNFACAAHATTNLVSVVISYITQESQGIIGLYSINVK